MTTTPPDTPTDSRTDEGPRPTGELLRDLGRLRRSRSDRKVAGVAGGLARHLDVDPLILRVTLVVLVFFGGAGLIIYGACWLLVPDEATGSAPLRLDERSRTVLLLIVGALALVALLGDAWGGFGFPWPLVVIGIVTIVVLSVRGPAVSTAEARPTGYAAVPAGDTGTAPLPASSRRSRNPRRQGPILFWFTLALVVFSEGVLAMVDLSGVGVPDSAYPALALGLIGLLLLIGSVWGRAGGLILAGLLAALVLIGLTFSDGWDGDVVREEPAQASAVQAEYAIDAGELVLDLRNVADIENLDGRAISVTGEVGHLEVILPAGLDAEVVADVHGVGDIGLFGQHVDGFDIDLTRSHDGGANVPAVTIDAELGLGEIEVH